jgi:hypothetical protein
MTGDVQPTPPVLHTPVSRSWRVSERPVVIAFRLVGKRDPKLAKLSLASVHPSGNNARIIERTDGMH